MRQVTAPNPSAIRPRESDQDDRSVREQPRPATSQWRVCWASYLGQGPQTCGAVDQIPEQLRPRSLAVHAFDAKGIAVGFEVVDGHDLEAAIMRRLADPRVARLRICSVPRSNHLARIERT